MLLHQGRAGKNEGYHRGKKKVKEALKDIKPSDFEAKKEKEEKALTVKD